LKTKDFDLKGKNGGAKAPSQMAMPSGGWREDIFVCKLFELVRRSRDDYGGKRFAGETLCGLHKPGEHLSV
jgi:hypothetical protein